MFLGLDNADIKTEQELLENNNVIRSEVSYGDRIESLKELEDRTDISIKAEVLPDKINIKGKHYFGYTISKVKIKEIYKVNDLKVGDIIFIVEPYCRNYLNNKEYLFIDDNYMPTEIGKEYIFVLKVEDYLDQNNNSIQAYVMWNTILGKYPVVNNKLRSNQDVETMANEELELSTNNEDFKNIYKDILNKYN